MLPKWVTTVTPLSKMIALFFLIALPVASFYYGRAYEEASTQVKFVENEVTVNEQWYELNSPTASPTSPLTPAVTTAVKVEPVDKKYCTTAADCGLLICSGCFNKEWLKDAPTEPACRVYEGYRCECVNNTCLEAR